MHISKQCFTKAYLHSFGREGKQLFDMMIPLLIFFGHIYSFRKENRKEEKRTEREQSSKKDSFGWHFHTVMWQIMLIYSNAFNIFLSFFRSRSTSFAHPRFSGHFVSLAKPYASMHSIHFTCHIIHVYVFRFKINRTKGKCRHSIYVSFERETSNRFHTIHNIFSMNYQCIHWIPLRFAWHCILFIPDPIQLAAILYAL